MVKVETKQYDQGNAHYVQDVTPDGFAVIDEYRPHSCPWDYYAMKHQMELTRVLQAAGIVSVRLRKLITIIHPVGTGPGGAVRFGDNMTPGEYRIAVPYDDVDKAHAAIRKHKVAVLAWLDNKGPMPEACKE